MAVRGSVFSWSRDGFVCVGMDVVSSLATHHIAGASITHLEGFLKVEIEQGIFTVDVMLNEYSKLL